MNAPANSEHRSVVRDESGADRRVRSPPPAPSERELSRTLEAASSCQRAEMLRVILVSNPMAGPQARTSLVEAERKCSQVPGAQDADMEALALRAAKLGNAAAAACFVSGTMRTAHPPAQRAAADERYRNEVPALVEQGIAAGNWAMAAEVAAMSRPRSAHGPYRVLDPIDPVIGYTYTKLLELGAEGDEKLDLELVTLQLSKGMAEAVRRKADHNAQQLYENHFHDSGPYSHERITLCTDF